MASLKPKWRPMAALLMCSVAVALGYPMFGDEEDDFMAIKRMMDSPEHHHKTFGPFEGMPPDISAFYEEENYPYEYEGMGRPSPGVGPPEADLLQEDFDWPAEYVIIDVGQVGGVAIDDGKNVHVFHRGKHVWDMDTFDENDTYTKQDDGPISTGTISILDGYDGKLLGTMGSNMFYMPHGMTLDQDGNYWLTDVAMHQVFKYSAEEDRPLITLGRAFEPATGNDDQERFCQPTDVAVASNGMVFVSDGYCNSRIVVFNENGTYLGAFGKDDFLVPHSLALAEDLDLLCVADRDNERILLFNAGLEDEELLGQFEQEIAFPQLGRVFGIAYSPMEGQLLAVTQASYGMEEATAYTIDLHDLENKYAANWTPNDREFSMPHDIDVSQDGDVAYVGLIDMETDRRVWKFDRA